jgi:hypothetical protein
MEKNRKNKIRRTLERAAMITAVILALASCTVSVNSGYNMSAPIIYATTNRVGQIIVSWNPVSDAVGYNVYDTTTQGTITYLGKGFLDASGTYYYYFDNVPYSGTYYYRVESIYPDGGISALSAEVGGYAY